MCRANITNNIFETRFFTTYAHTCIKLKINCDKTFEYVSCKVENILMYCRFVSEHVHAEIAQNF